LNHADWARLWLRGPGTAIQRLYPRPLHQRFDMPTADLAPLGSQSPDTSYLMRQNGPQKEEAMNGIYKVVLPILISIATLVSAASNASAQMLKQQIVGTWTVVSQLDWNRSEAINRHHR